MLRTPPSLITPNKRGHAVPRRIAAQQSRADIAAPGLPRRQWLAASFGVDVIFWAITVAHELIVRGPFIDFAGDWARFWGAARAFTRVSPSAGYQVPQIAASMQPLGRYLNPTAGGVRPGPVPYPPIFLRLIAWFTIPSPLVGLAVWILLNAALALLVARRLARRFDTSAPWVWTLALAGFFPVALTLFAGQVEILLLACLMLAVEAFERGREGRAGFWLGWLLLKPQYAAILILVLLVKRRAAALAGVAASAALLLFGSLAVGGIAGERAYVAMLAHAYPAYSGGVGIDPRGMIGWRGLAATIFPFLEAAPSLLLVAALSVITLAPLAWIWRGPWRPQSPRFARQLAAAIAATLLVAYHNQPHGATLLLVPGAIVAADPETPRVMRTWLVGIAAAGPVIGLVSALAFGTLWLVGPAMSVGLAAVLAIAARMELARPAQRRGAAQPAKRSPAWESG